MKKTISILLTFVIAFSFSCSVFAASDQISDINNGWYWPTSSNERTITSEFGRARPEKNYPDKVHQAIDIAASEGKPVYATREGEVVETFDSCKGSHKFGQCSCDGGKYYGNYVVIYTPTNQGSVAMNSYKLKGKELVVTSTTPGNYRSDGKTVSGETSYKIVTVNN